MFDFIESELYPIYLIQYNKDIPVGYDLSQTVGVSCYEKLFIGGTPSLIHIVNKEVFVNIAGAEKVTTYIDLFMFNYYRLLKI